MTSPVPTKVPFRRPQPCTAHHQVAIAASMSKCNLICCMICDCGPGIFEACEQLMQRDGSFDNVRVSRERVCVHGVHTRDYVSGVRVQVCACAHVCACVRMRVCVRAWRAPVCTSACVCRSAHVHAHVLVRVVTVFCFCSWTKGLTADAVNTRMAKQWFACRGM